MSNANIANAIASGHAYTNHAYRFNVSSQEDFEAIIERILNAPTETKTLRRGRVAYWDSTFAAIVIVDPNHPDQGTAFIPSRGKRYFDNQR